MSTSNMHTKHYSLNYIVQGFNDTRSSSNQLYKVPLSHTWVLSLSMRFNTKCHFVFSSLLTHKCITSLISQLIYSM